MVRDPARIDRMCELLRQLWHAMPDQRLGQLFGNLYAGPEQFFMEDDVMERKLSAAITDGIQAAWRTK